MKYERGDLRIWWTSNPPRKAFRRRVNNVNEAIKVINLLADYDLYLEDLISMNACGLEIFEDGKWDEYYNEDGDDIQQIMDNKGE